MLRGLGAALAYARRHHAGLLALFVALGGTAYAATLPRDSVGTAQLRDGAVTAAKVRDGSLTARDLRPSARASTHQQVFGRFRDGPITTTNTAQTLLSVSVPAGDWVILAKVTAFADLREYECRVHAEGDFDRARLGTVATQNVGARETLTMTVLHRSTDAFTARIVCPDNDTTSGFQLRDLKLTAIKVDGISNRGF